MLRYGLVIVVVAAVIGVRAIFRRLWSTGVPRDLWTNLIAGIVFVVFMALGIWYAVYAGNTAVGVLSGAFFGGSFLIHLGSLIYGKEPGTLLSADLIILSPSIWSFVLMLLVGAAFSGVGAWILILERGDWRGMAVGMTTAGFMGGLFLFGLYGLLVNRPMVTMDLDGVKLGQAVRKGRNPMIRWAQISKIQFLSHLRDDFMVIELKEPSSYRGPEGLQINDRQIWIPLRSLPVYGSAIARSLKAFPVTVEL